jgi:hypothetical protein
MSTYDETLHPRGKNPANVGQYSAKDHADAEGVELGIGPGTREREVMTAEDRRAMVERLQAAHDAAELLGGSGLDAFDGLSSNILLSAASERPDAELVRRELTYFADRLEDMEANVRWFDEDARDDFLSRVAAVRGD